MSSNAFYNEMATVARELLTEFGQAWTLTRTTGEDIDDVTGVVTPGSDTVYTPQGVLVEFNREEKAEGRIEHGDRKLILDDTIEPLLDDVLTLEGESWTIVDIEKVKPAAVDLIYKVQVRG